MKFEQHQASEASTDAHLHHYNNHAHIAPDIGQIVYLTGILEMTRAQQQS
jgi:hypothetical protein